MAHLALVILSIFGSLATASVWDEMRELNKVEGAIESVQVDGEKMFVQLKDHSERYQICEDQSETAQSEEMRAILFKIKHETLTKAQEGNKPVTLGIIGPWNPCAKIDNLNRHDSSKG